MPQDAQIMGQAFTVVDAFTDRPFAGNPAAVCLLAQAVDEAWMRAVAREMNLSETAFLHPEGDGYRLRWFTPSDEVEICGHATLASAHVLFESGALAAGEQARFHTRSGLLTAVRSGPRIVLDFPAMPMRACEPPREVLAALGVKARWAGESGPNYLLELGSEAEVRAVAPDFRALRALRVRSVAVTARAGAGPYDIVSRFFAPGAGVDEDPVTGGAHCALGPFWAERIGKRELNAYQASARGGSLVVTVLGERVLLAGHAVTISRGEILGPEASR
jgi:PhzF family phenazine biosynthesis protein